MIRACIGIAFSSAPYYVTWQYWSVHKKEPPR